MLKAKNCRGAYDRGAREAALLGSARAWKASMKAREDRQKVMIKARMRSGAAWRDVCVLNVSAHGLGIQSAEPPTRGTYVEIRRGRETIIARVIWNKGHRAGLRSQDPIFIQALIDGSAADYSFEKSASATVERRRVPRPAAPDHERSRMMGRTIEFACFTLIAAVLALTTISAIAQALSQPMSAVGTALDSGAPADPPVGKEHG